jgi:lipoprotein-anchoring transpeptidase ErfK/SrfK
MIVRGATERAGLLLAHRIVALDWPLVSTKADTTGFVVFSRRSVLLAIVGLAGCSRAVQTELADPLVTNSFAALPDEPEVSANELTKRNPELARQLVPYNGPEQPGTVIVRTNERKLYYVLDEGRAVRYPVGVGRAGKQWQGRAES